MPLPIAAARIAAGDVFAACKRVLLTAQMGWVDTAVVGPWMLLVEAVEEKDLPPAIEVQSGRCSFEVVNKFPLN